MNDTLDITDRLRDAALLCDEPDGGLYAEAAFVIDNLRYELAAVRTTEKTLTRAAARAVARPAATGGHHPHNKGRR